MITHTALVLPAASNLVNQCQIVARRGRIQQALKDYRESPHEWHIVGTMSLRGELERCAPYGDLVEELKASQPLRAGLEVPFHAPDCPF